MRVIFVGIHNKRGCMPLDSKTKTGSIVNRIIAELPGCVVLKTNLIDMDHIPEIDEVRQCAQDWLSTHVPDANDVVILLGSDVHDLFPKHVSGTIIKVAHPASRYTVDAREKYIKSVSEKIKAAMAAAKDYTHFSL